VRDFVPIGIGDCNYNWIMIDCQWLPITSNDWTVIDYPALLAGALPADLRTMFGL